MVLNYNSALISCSKVDPFFKRSFQLFSYESTLYKMYFLILDIDECTTSNPATQHQCHENATCNDEDGSYTCMCNVGYTGNGFDICDGKWLLFTEGKTTLSKIKSPVQSFKARFYKSCITK